ncbi:MAG: D-2-hydroxyacid dehydrogenase, partial [Campylobacteraceae bacterium]
KLTSYPATLDNEKLERSKDADIIITNKVVFDKEALIKLPKLKLICLLATGMNNIDLQTAKELGIVVKNVAGYSTNSVTQVTFMLVLALVGRLRAYNDYVRDGEWCNSPVFTNLERPFYEISGKKWGIIGLGTIGKEVAKIATAFGCEVYYYSTSGVERKEDYKRLSLDELLKTCDIVTIHAPLNDKTKNLIDKKELALMKKDAVLVNLGRGGIVNEVALREIIDKKKLFIGTDVLEFEPMRKDSPLYGVTCRRVIITPHIGWGSVEARNKLVGLVCENIKTFIEKGV